MKRAALFLILSAIPLYAGDIPTVADTQAGRILKLPDDITKALTKEFPNYRIPADSEYDPEMLNYYFRQLIGIHPAVCWGDFNQDKKRDYALIVITGTTPWGPLVELVVFNGTGKREYELTRLGELNSVKDDYVSFSGGKLYKGTFRKNGWYINWDKKVNTYVVHKS